MTRLRAEDVKEALIDLDSVVSLILHRHTIDPPLPFDEKQRLRSAIGVLRRLDDYGLASQEGRASDG